MHTDHAYREPHGNNWYRMSGNWHILKGKLRQRWGEFTHEDLDHLAGGFYEELSGKIQKIYGVNKKEADRQIREWLDIDRSSYTNCGSSSGDASGTMSP
ncbi:MAG: general stress protein CsbD [Nitrococcus sp.]|nr:general stress protein CsbD [Nitrococcus sp.]